MKLRRKRRKTTYRLKFTDWTPPKQPKGSPMSKQRGRWDSDGSNRTERKVRGSQPVNESVSLPLIEEETLVPPLGRFY